MRKHINLINTKNKLKYEFMICNKNRVNTLFSLFTLCVLCVWNVENALQRQKWLISLRLIEFKKKNEDVK